MLDIDYPQSARETAFEKHFGESVSDPYRWLEDNHTASSRVAEWIAAQNAITERHLKTLPARDAFRQRIAALVNYESFTIPLKRADRYFFTRRDGTSNQAALYVREDVNGVDRLLLNPNKWSEDEADALGEWSASDDGRYVAFGVQNGGTDWRTIKVLDVDSGETAEDVVERARFTRIAWAPDGSGFFYSRYPAPLEGTAMDASLANQAVYFHKLGTTQDVDRLVYSTPQDPKLLNIAERVTNGRYLHITTTPGTPESALTVIDLASDAWTPKTVVPDMNSEWSVIGNDGTRLILVTTHGSERRRVVTLDVSEPEPRPVELIPEDANGAIINDAAVVGGKLLIAYTVDAKTEFRRFDLDGTEEGPIKLPGIGTAGGFSVDPSENEAFFLFTSYDVPTSIYRYRVADGAPLLWEKPEVKVDSARIVVEQRFYHSKDGTRVPIFITRRADATEAAPTLLYGYGGFGISLLPDYNPFRLAWVQQGGILAVANIRGGGEYGKAWHRAGQRENKQNVFDDFIAAAEFLKAERISTPRGLTIQGESGGGLLVGAVTTNAPNSSTPFCRVSASWTCCATTSSPEAIFGRPSMGVRQRKPRSATFSHILPITTSKRANNIRRSLSRPPTPMIASSRLTVSNRSRRCRRRTSVRSRISSALKPVPGMARALRWTK